MNLIDNSTIETEQDRQRLIRELVDDHGPQWADEFKPGSFGCHELLDRTSMLVDLVEREIASHPACVMNPGWYQLAQQAVGLLAELYQRVGAAHAETESPPSRLSDQ
jgi:hypothetical protein